MLIMNEALGTKLICLMYRNLEYKWVKILRHKYLNNKCKEQILTIKYPPRGLAIWNFMILCSLVICGKLVFVIHPIFGKSPGMTLPFCSSRFYISHSYKEVNLKVDTISKWVASLTPSNDDMHFEDFWDLIGRSKLYDSPLEMMKPAILITTRLRKCVEYGNQFIRW